MIIPSFFINSNSLCILIIKIITSRYYLSIKSLLLEYLDASRKALKVAVGLGFEPRLMGPKPIVLPLDDPTIELYYLNVFYVKNQLFL